MPFAERVDALRLRYGLEPRAHPIPEDIQRDHPHPLSLAAWRALEQVGGDSAAAIKLTETWLREDGGLQRAVIDWIIDEEEHATRVYHMRVLRERHALREQRKSRKSRAVSGQTRPGETA
jgi:hypothetical protein